MSVGLPTQNTELSDPTLPRTSVLTLSGGGAKRLLSPAPTRAGRNGRAAVSALPSFPQRNRTSDPEMVPPVVAQLPDTNAPPGASPMQPDSVLLFCSVKKFVVVPNPRPCKENTSLTTI